MSKYSELLTLLRDCADQSDDELRILSNSLSGMETALEECNVNYEKQAEGILIDLSVQAFKIYKNRAAAVRYLSPNDFSSDILVIEKGVGGEDVVYENGESISKLFENILYFQEFKKMFIDDEIASYHDEVARKIIFLSPKQGRLDVGYKEDLVEEFYEADNDLENQFKAIELKITQNDEYKNFFRESFIEVSKNLSPEDTRFVKSLVRIKHIVESATRNYELYQHNFSFAEFKQQLDEDKEKYLKEYQSNLSDFLFKIASMPIQFGVYIYLTIRFGEELVPILGTMILIISWSCFTVFSVNRIVENVKYLKNKFESDFSMMLEQSGIEKAVVETDRNQIVSRLNKAIYLIKSYMGIVVIFSICIIVFCGYFIFLYLSNPCL